MNLMTYWTVWGVLALVAVVAFLIRQKTAANEIDSVRLAAGEEPAQAFQQELGKKLDVLDKWCKILASAAGVSLLVLLCAQVYVLWTASNVAVR